MNLRTAATAALALSAALLLAGCSPENDRELLADHDLAGLDAPQIIERLDTMPVAERPADLLASVQTDELVLSDSGGREARLPLPDDEVYLSIAPYRDLTHECHFHSLTTCVGELAGAEMRITLTDANGDVLIDETRRSYDNGFVGVWVPRGIEAELVVEHDGRVGTAPISTRSPDDPTCITTLRLV